MCSAILLLVGARRCREREHEREQRGLHRAPPPAASTAAAAAGGGDKGMKRCDREEDFSGLWQSAAREARGAFGDDRLYIERCLEPARHVEIQVFADARGNTIWLGERECSVQRRQQKVIEESPTPAVDGELPERMGAVAVRAATRAAEAAPGSPAARASSPAGIQTAQRAPGASPEQILMENAENEFGVARLALPEAARTQIIQRLDSPTLERPRVIGVPVPGRPAEVR